MSTPTLVKDSDSPPATPPAGRAHQPRRSPMRWFSDFVDAHVKAAFITPALAFVTIMMAFPIGYTIFLSLHSWFGSVTRPPDFIGLDNFVRIFTGDPRFWAALGRTLAFTGMAVAVETVLGVAIAVLLHREFVGRGLVRSLMLLPMIATPVAVALVWRLMFQPELGVLNDILVSVGLSPSTWVADPSIALLCLVLVDVWEWTSLITLITLSGLTALPHEPMEAAAVDGATPWQRFWYVTLPMVRPVVVIAVVFRLIEALKTFDPIIVITQGGPGFATETLNIYIYNTAFQYQQLGYAAALLLVFFVIVFAVAGLILRFRRGKESA